MKYYMLTHYIHIYTFLKYNLFWKNRKTKRRKIHSNNTSGYMCTCGLYVTSTIRPRKKEKRLIFRVRFSRWCVDSEVNFASARVLSLRAYSHSRSRWCVLGLHRHRKFCDMMSEGFCFYIKTTTCSYLDKHVGALLWIVFYLCIRHTQYMYTYIWIHLSLLNK